MSNIRKSYSLLTAAILTIAAPGLAQTRMRPTAPKVEFPEGVDMVEIPAYIDHPGQRVGLVPLLVARPLFDAA